MEKTPESKVIRIPVKPDPPAVFPPQEPDEQDIEPVKPKSSRAITKENLAEFLEEQLAKHARKLVASMNKNLDIRLNQMDSKAVDQVMELYGYKKTGNGFMVNILNNNVSGSEGTDGTYFEKIIAMMERKDRPDIIDVTPEKQ